MSDIKGNNQGMKVLITGSVLQLFLGIIYVWSAFVTPVEKYFSWDKPAVKLTSSFMLCCFVLGILFGGKLQTKIGTAKIVLTGGMLMALGMLATSFIPKDSTATWIIYVTYGILGGFGVGMAYNAIISCAQKWFPQRRGMATGISVCMFGFSTVIFAPLVNALIGYKELDDGSYVFEQFGIVTTFRILAVAFAVVTLLLFSFIKMPADTGTQAAATGISEQKQYTTSEMLKNKSFYFISLSMMFLTAAYFILNPTFKDLAKARGFTDTIATGILMMTGIASASGRLIVPLLGDKIGRERAILTILALTVLGTAALIFAKGALFVAAIAFISFCYGGSSGIYPVVTADHFGIKNIGSNYGTVMVGFMLSSLCFPMIIGKIGDPKEVDVPARFIALTILGLLGVLMVIFLSLSKKKKAKA